MGRTKLLLLNLVDRLRCWVVGNLIIVLLKQKKKGIVAELSQAIM